MVDSTALASEILKLGHRVRIPTIGNSMHPHIRFREIIHVKPATMCDIAIGDIAVYAIGKSMVAHRALKKGQDENGVFLITKGDSMRFPDGLVRPGQVLGKVVTVERGTRLLDLSSPRMHALGRFYAWISPFSFITYPFLWRIEKAFMMLRDLGRGTRARPAATAGNSDHLQPVPAPQETNMNEAN